MEIDLITAEIDTIHQKVNLAFERKDMAIYMSQFDDSIRYTNADATVYDRKDLVYQTEKYFKKTKEISTTYYRIKSSLENQIFTEKIARKSIVFEKGLMFAKKKTVQTEEILNWKKIDGNWKVTGIEVVLEEKY